VVDSVIVCTAIDIEDERSGFGGGAFGDLEIAQYLQEYSPWQAVYLFTL